MNRVSELRKRLQGNILIDNRKNMFYLTGYTGEGCLLVTPKRSVIITDFRYIEQAERQSPECEIERTSVSCTREEIVKRLLSDEGAKELYVETGILTVVAFRKLEGALTGVKLLDMPATILEMRAVKDQSEIDCICKAAAISCEAFEALLGQLKAGMTEKYAAAILEHEMRLRGSAGPAFNTIVASGVNGSLPHAVPSDKLIENGDLVTFDFGASFGGYCSDMTRTVAVGKPNQELTDIYNAVYTAHMTSLAAVSIGKTGKEIDAIARDYLEKLYPGAFGHSLGHGVGLDVHEAPSLSLRGDTVLVKGHVVTVEPGVYIPGVGGCRIEDTVILTETGFIDPYTVSKQLIVV